MTKTRIHRGVENDTTFVSPRSAPQNRNLTFESRGMLWYMLSKPGDWIVQPSDLQQKCGKNQVYRILGELIDRGYMVRTIHRDSKGRVSEVEYDVYSTPIFCPLLRNQEVDFPDVENRDSTEERKEQKRDSTDNSSFGVPKEELLPGIDLEPESTPPKHRQVTERSLIYNQIAIAYFKVDPMKDKAGFAIYAKATQKICTIFLKLYPAFTAETCAKFLLHLYKYHDNFQDYMRAESNIGPAIGKWLNEEGRKAKIAESTKTRPDYILPEGFAK